jgi:hypothetical protein
VNGSVVDTFANGKTTRLRPPVVHVDAIAGRDPLHQAVEDFLAVLGLVEAEVPEVIQEAAGLRRDLRVDALDVAGERVRIAEIIVRLVPQPRVPVADGREPQAVHRRARRRVRELVDVVGGEGSPRRLQPDRGFARARELPS